MGTTDLSATRESDPPYPPAAATVKSRRTHRQSLLRRVLEPLRSEPQRLLLLLCYLIFVAGWSAIAIWRFYSFDANIFDLGVAMERGWLIYHTSWTTMGVLDQLFTSGIVFLVFPITIPQSYPMLLVFQSAEVGAAAFPLYGIAKRSGLSPTLALLISAGFLVYFPITGELYIDFHYQTLFMLLFLAGYYYHIRRDYRVSTPLLFLSGTVRFPYAIFPFVFALWTIGEVLVSKRKSTDNAKRSGLWYGVALLGATAVFLVGGYALSGAQGFASNLQLSNSTSGTTDLNTRLLTVLFFLGPVLLVPLFSPKWVTFLIPAGYLFLLSGSPLYSAPSVYISAYAAGVAPFVFLGFIDGLPRAARFFDSILPSIPSSSRKWRSQPISSLELVTGSVTVLVVCALVLSPYGPLNANSGKYNLHFYDSPGPNWTRFREVVSVIGFIPASTPYIIAQEGLPELYPRPLAQPVYPVVNPVLTTFPSNITMTEVADNRIPINVYGTLETTRADYVVGDPYLWTMTVGNPSILHFMQLMYESGHFGVVAEESAITLLARDYHAPVKVFVPWSDYLAGYNYSASLQGVAGASSASASMAVPATVTWRSQSDYFVPGGYQVSVKIWAGAPNCSATMNLSLLNVASGNYSSLALVRSCDLTPYQWNWVNATVPISDMWESALVQGSFSDWPGASMSQALMTELEPPLNTGVI